MTVLHVNSTSSAQEVDEVIRWADIVCLCTALRDETRHLIDGRRLAMMSKTAILINVARGAVVDQGALYEVLLGGNIRGAGLDVFEDEPTGEGAPRDIVRLATLPNVVATPHIAYNTQETVARLGEELIMNLQSCLAGSPQNVVARGTAP
jgi:phosphoglycerate dehydrogenase-like enzyme